MATIECLAVTKSFERPTFFTGGGAVNRRMLEGNTDRAFAERVINSAEAGKESHITAGGRIMALDRVNLTIPDGQTVAIVGPSGCGKSTLLRIVAGLDTEFEGKVLYDGQDMRNVPAKDRFIGMVFQSYALYPHFKGQGNLGFFFKVHKIDDKAAEERIRVTSEIMGIGFDALLARKPGTLSGGQQQRLAIGRAIVRNPRLFLFDEPLSNLDAKLRVQTRLEIKRLLHRFNITSIYVTHDQVEAIALSDLIAVMRAGKIEQIGDYATLRDSPVSTFVASFLGAPPMNLLAGGVVADGRLQLGAIDIPLPADIQARVHSGQALTAGIRPEQLQLVSSSGAGLMRAPADGIRLRGAVEMIEPDFAHQSQVVYIRSGELYFAIIAALDTVVAGETVEVALPVDQFHFFDAASEQRIAAG